MGEKIDFSISPPPGVKPSYSGLATLETLFPLNSASANEDEQLNLNVLGQVVAADLGCTVGLRDRVPSSYDLVPDLP